MTGDTELVTGDPRWHNFLPGISPLGLFFTGVEASGALSRDVARELESFFDIGNLPIILVTESLCV